MQGALQNLERGNKQEEATINILKAEDAKHRDQIDAMRKQNDESAKKVSLYEDPELEDAMQERAQVALDRKEKALQAELQERLSKFLFPVPPFLPSSLSYSFSYPANA